MKFYEKYFKSSYDELITYYPRFYRGVFEMAEILKAFGKISDGLEGNIEQAYLNNFILTADMETVKIWEQILGITYEARLTLDQRKRVVIGRISGYGHIGEPEIRGIIANYTENAVAVDFAQGVITVIINGDLFDETNLLNTLLQRIPAHLALNMSVRIQRTFRQRLDICYGGATGADFKPQPVGEDKKSRIPFNIGYSGWLETDFKIEPISEDRSSATPLPVAHSGYLSPTWTGLPPVVERASTGHTDGAGGIFYHTHVKSKLIG